MRNICLYTVCVTLLLGGALAAAIKDDLPADEATIEEARALQAEQRALEAEEEALQAQNEHQEEREDELNFMGEPSFYTSHVHPVPNSHRGQSALSLLKSLGLSGSGFLHSLPDLELHAADVKSAPISYEDVQPIRGELDYMEERPISDQLEAAPASYKDESEAIYDDPEINVGLRGGDAGTGQVMEQQDLPEYVDEGAEGVKPDVEELSKDGSLDDVPLHPAAPEALRQDESDKMPSLINRSVNSMADVYFLAVVTGCSIAGVVGLIVAGVCWYRLQKNVKAASDVDYPAYGVTGPTKERLSSPSDRKLAQSAQMYHYQHQKQQMIAIEKAHSDLHKEGSDNDSEEENEEGDYTVFECPGLAPTGEMEVKNPLFSEDTPVTPAGENQQHK